ncbi:uncharacterized protein LOC135826233 [Sycon ciliatum]|uniref:uncharacterized protein LOC135826233 n=1 Tax=Sycon ciliatum TaxID=27933 RepID=UPI0031F6D308
MSLDQNLDLALIGYQELIAIAERKSLDSPSSLARPELVQALRKHGVGGKPVTDTGTTAWRYSPLTIDPCKVYLTGCTCLTRLQPAAGVAHAHYPESVPVSGVTTILIKHHKLLGVPVLTKLAGL